jgi:glycosyltransferase involved in cell wall biosynthesis
MQISKRSTDVLIITPIFHGSASGAAIYYKLLYKELTKQGFSVAIISEKTGRSNGVSYYGLFPKRCSRDKDVFKDLALYTIQNIAYFLIPRLIKIYKPKTLLVHSSFYNLPGIFPAVMDYIRLTQSKIRIVIDIRDQLLPPIWIKRIKKFNKVIACSENVMEYLCTNGMNKKFVHLIPVIQEPIRIDENLFKNILSSLNLNDKKYIFYAGLVKEKKAIDIILKAFILYMKKEMPDLRLVISGLIKTYNKKIIQQLKDDHVIYIGNRKREEVLSLMSKASLCINISPNEGLPRSSLESLALKRPTLLPPNVPEFSKCCSKFVYLDSSPRALANKMICIMKGSEVAAYPVEKHLPNRVLPKYKEILKLN